MAADTPLVIFGQIDKKKAFTSAETEVKAVSKFQLMKLSNAIAAEAHYQSPTQHPFSDNTRNSSPNRHLISANETEQRYCR
ncbi:hypothetical protein G8C92_10545 [Paenibacillus donghaensis]|uniref:hypothetical protein n=1 Tax=Paenibacillus donghaensis TaxID=414771 RepID=UPI0018844DD6|nr:hypothetical protein [Paenibacillus donghaensis]MBE9914469.1 hypothetical protein [Paenibacillus donghaensis]